MRRADRFSGATQKGNNRKSPPMQYSPPSCPSTGVFLVLRRRPKITSRLCCGARTPACCLESPLGASSPWGSERRQECPAQRGPPHAGVRKPQQPVSQGEVIDSRSEERR